MPTSTITMTNKDINKILNHEAPYDNTGGWGNAAHIVLSVSFTYDVDSTGMSAKKCFVDAAYNYSGSPHPPASFNDHKFQLYFNSDITTHLQPGTATITYATYSSSLGYFVEGSNTKTATVVKSTNTINSQKYSYLMLSTNQYGRYLSRAGETFSTIENTYVDATSVPAADYSTINEMMGTAAYNYFNAQPVETFSVDMDVWSTADSYFTFEISNLQGAALPAASYFYRLAYNPAGDRQSYVGLQPYTANSPIQMSYETIYNSLPTDSARQSADNLGYISLHLCLAHHDDSDPRFFINDTMCNVNLYPTNGNMVLDSFQPTCHCTLHIRESQYQNDSFPDDDANEDYQVPGQEMSVDNLLTTSYAVDESALKAFGGWLWANNLTNLENVQTAPIENILSCKRIPFHVPDVSRERLTQIKCGNLLTGVGYDEGTHDFDGRVKIADSTHKQVIGEMTIPTFTGDFIDMQNNISIYLPYCGIYPIPATLCYKQAKDENGNPYLTGRKLKVEYYFDIVYGTCVALLYMGNKLFATYNGECGIDIPLTSSNRASNELALKKMGSNTITSALISGVGGLLNASLPQAIVGAGSELLKGFLHGKNEKDYQETHFSTSGGFSSQIASFMTSSVTLIIEHTKYKEPATYAHDNGYPCNISYNLSDLKGYTEIDGACEMVGCECFEEEKVALKQALMEGFYL